jgi:hypothetical protein
MLGAGFVFMPRTWMMLAADWPVATAQYLLTLLPLIWLVRHRVARS